MNILRTVMAIFTFLGRWLTVTPSSRSEVLVVHQAVWASSLAACGCDSAMSSWPKKKWSGKDPAYFIPRVSKHVCGEPVSDNGKINIPQNKIERGRGVGETIILYIFKWISFSPGTGSDHVKLSVLLRLRLHLIKSLNQSLRLASYSMS